MGRNFSDTWSRLSLIRSMALDRSSAQVKYAGLDSRSFAVEHRSGVGRETVIHPELKALSYISLPKASLCGR